MFNERGTGPGYIDREDQEKLQEGEEQRRRAQNPEKINRTPQPPDLSSTSNRPYEIDPAIRGGIEQQQNRNALKERIAFLLESWPEAKRPSIREVADMIDPDSLFGEKSALQIEDLATQALRRFAEEKRKEQAV